jgi:hypothetical protein
MASSRFLSSVFYSDIIQMSRRIATEQLWNKRPGLIRISCTRIDLTVAKDESGIAGQ